MNITKESVIPCEFFTKRDPSPNLAISSRRSGRSSKPSQRIRALLRDDADNRSLAELFPQYPELLDEQCSLKNSRTIGSSPNVVTVKKTRLTPRPRPGNAPLLEEVIAAKSAGCSPVKCVTVTVDRFGRVTADVEVAKKEVVPDEFDVLLTDPAENSEDKSADSSEDNAGLGGNLPPLNVMLEPEDDESLDMARQLLALSSDLDPGPDVGNPTTDLQTTATTSQISVEASYVTGYQLDHNVCQFDNNNSEDIRPNNVDNILSCDEDDDDDYFDKCSYFDDHDDMDYDVNPDMVSNTAKRKRSYPNDRKKQGKSRLTDSGGSLPGRFPQHQCGKCELQFATVGLLKKHQVVHEDGYVQRHEQQGFLTCLKCGLAVGTAQLLEIHESRVHQDRQRRYACEYCEDQLFSDIASFRLHRKQVHNIAYRLRTEFSGDPTNTAKRAPRKKRRGAGRRQPKKKTGAPPVSDGGNIVGSSHSESIVGVEGTGKDGAASDKLVAKPTNSIVALENTAKVSKPAGESSQPAPTIDNCSAKERLPPQLPCRFCSRKFHSRKLVTVHQRSEHADKRYKCRICADFFVSQAAVTKHLVNDHRQPMSKCQFCDYESSWPQTIRNHERRIHMDEKNEVCPHCDKRFFNATELKSHVVTHDPTLRVMCELCGMEFTTKARVKEHMVAFHISPEKHKCPFCQKIFTQLLYLEQHIVRHTRMGDYVCEGCNIDFCSKYALNKHRKANCPKDKRTVHVVVTTRSQIGAKRSGLIGATANSDPGQWTTADEAGEIMRQESGVSRLEEDQLPLVLVHKEESVL